MYDVIMEWKHLGMLTTPEAYSSGELMGLVLMVFVGVDLGF